MSATSGPNAAEARYWTEEAGPRWVRFGERMDAQLEPIGAVGLARTAMELAAQYAKQRIQFDVPIAHHQAVQFMLADMAIGIDAARLLVWRAASLADHGVRNSREAAISKAFAADVAMRVTTDAVQIYGGMGYTKWHPVEKLMRDAKVIQIYEGSAQIMRRIIARSLLEQTQS